MPETHVHRRDALRAHLRDSEVDAVLVTDLLNIRYLTGFTGSNAALLVHAADSAGSERNTVFCTDGRYRTQASEQVPDLEHLIDRASAQRLAEHVESRVEAYRRVGFESQHVTVDGRDALESAAPSAELVRAPGLVERQRLVKDADEIEALRAACAAADRALAELIEHGGCVRDAANWKWPGSSRAGCWTTAPRGRPSRRSWPPVRTRPCRTTGRRRPG